MTSIVRGVYRVLWAALLPIRAVVSVLGRITGLHRLPSTKAVSLVLAATVFVFTHFGNIAPNVSALGTIDDGDYPDFLISRDSFIEKYGQGTEDPKQIVAYTVVDGDTLSSIAATYNISVNTIKSVNKLTSGTINPGDTLQVPNIDVLLYTVKKNDTIEKIAKNYSANDELIRWYNSLTDDALIHAGDAILIPGGIEPGVPRDRAVQEGGRGGRYVSAGPNAPVSGSGTFQMPAFGTVWIRGFTGYHTGWDISSKTGTPIYAGADGVIEKASVGTWGGGYGTHVIINHGNGLKTLYAHLSAVSVDAGQSVSRGENIGQMGSTGRSTGPHLHFEVIDNGIKRNPSDYLSYSR